MNINLKVRLNIARETLASLLRLVWLLFTFLGYTYDYFGGLVKHVLYLPWCFINKLEKSWYAYNQLRDFQASLFNN